MYSESDIDGAVAAGVLAPAAAAALRDHVAATRQTAAVDDESFRLLTGFNDIFVSIALLLVLLPLSIGIIKEKPVASLIVAAISWGLAEPFTRRRRMALPSIVLLIAFVGACFGFVRGLIPIPDPAAGTLAAMAPAALAGIAAALGAWAHWLRFKVPITVAAGVAALVAAVFAATLSSENVTTVLQASILLIVGIVVFGIAMWWDGSDLRRETRRSDVAFWLHLLAAPLIAHSIFVLLGVFDGTLPPGRAVGIFVLYALFALVSIVSDRRALLVSGLAYFVYAAANLFGRADDAALLPAAIVVGATLLILSAFWGQVRAAVVIYLPHGLRDRVPPIRRAAQAGSTADR